MLLISMLAALQVAAAAPTAVIRVNQLGYLPDAPKVAVVCGLQKFGQPLRNFVVTRGDGKTVLQRPASAAKPFGPCIEAYRLDFSSLRAEGEYRIAAGDIAPVSVRIRRNAYAGAADTLLYYMREQ